MYLKSIEVQGFKSFANKIVFDFHNGITGIVGPNGSGKSNVADAVRWVLGEQRVKQLRGASMQDVIFSGTEARKPQGFAYVAITLDNTDRQLAIDYEQVTVARRIYRSGESEYMINGSACRLKDVYELFYDTGIGKEGYSIIGQGQIDKILSGKPEERRELFDEAAGIVKFKRRKGIAQKKLENERQNLVRVSDILAELEKQAGPLERQSKAAREYLRLREELKTCEANLFLVESQALKGQLKELQGKEAIVSGDLDEARQNSEQIKATYEELDESLAEINRQMEETRSQKSQAGLEKGNLEGQINVLLEQINTERMNAEHLSARIHTIEEEAGDRESQMEGYRRENAELESQARDSLKEQEAAQERLRREDEHIMLLEQKVENGKSGIILNLNERASLTARQQRYETMMEQVQVRHSEIAQKLLKSKSDESVQEEHKKAEQARLEEVGEDIKRLKAAQKAAQEEQARLEQEVRRLNRNVNERQQEYHADSSRLESLRNIAERYEGYGNSIRRVMEARDRVRGIHGVVADIITTQKEYETAVETALGGSIQNIVTDSEAVAKQLIEYLKKNRYGRATFLPLTSVSQKGGFSQEKALKEPGVIGLASDLVWADKRYEGVVRYLLGRVVVARHIDSAIALARKYQYSFRIVTLEGELLSPGGSMAGGAFKNSSSLLGRKREIEELESRCQKALRLAEKMEAELDLQESLLSRQREEVERMKGECQKAYLEQNTIEMNIANLEDKILEISGSASDFMIENTQLEEQLRDVRKSLEGLASEARELDDKKEAASQEVEALSLELEAARGRRETIAKELSAVQIRTAALRQKYQFVLENVNRVKEEIGKLWEEKLQLSQGSSNTDEAIGAKRQEIARIQGQILKVDEETERLKRQLEEKEALKEEKSRKQKGLFEKREELSERMGRLDKELFRLQSQQEKVEERLERQLDYMWSEYELTFSTAEALRDSAMGSIPDMKKQAEGLKTAIKGLGNVNVNAIEDYKEVSKRYEFMKAQHEDLTQAEATLRKIIDELDGGMRRQFGEKFKEIRQEFDKVFRELFGGGHGALELVEGEDMLEAGIQIIAQPPGKKLQNMMQLSGGEKALTAIALLFAIQNLKPSPFCLLDEIEAALDDSNVDRFAGYLHKLTKYTQFIVITHRRGTMVAADRLYGITMQEKGVSTLVSVSLIEGDLDE